MKLKNLVDLPEIDKVNTYASEYAQERYKNIVGNINLELDVGKIERIIKKSSFNAMTVFTEATPLARKDLAQALASNLKEIVK